MSSREKILSRLWNELIDLDPDGQWLDNWIENHRIESQRGDTAPFSDAGEALVRLRKLGASHTDLASVCRAVSYQAVFGTLYELDYFEATPGLGLYEELLSSDPSGREGRPVDDQAAI